MQTMALVMRGTRPYLYKSVRRGGRVRCVYQGSGAFALVAGQIEAEEREVERRQRARWHAERARIEAEESPVVEMYHAVESFARAALVATGHYQHHRSEWRKRGTMKTDLEKSEAKSNQARPALPAPDIPTFDLLKRAQDGDQEVRARLRAVLDRDGDLFAEYEMGHLTDVKLSKMGAGDNLIAQEVRLRELRRMAEELAGPDATPLERMLAHRVAVCQFAVTHAEYRLASQTCSGESVPISHIEYQERRIDVAHRRLLQASKMLATVRKLGVAGPTVNVHVNQTTNVEAKGEESPRLDVPSLMANPSRF